MWPLLHIVVEQTNFFAQGRSTINRHSILRNWQIGVVTTLKSSFAVCRLTLNLYVTKCTHPRAINLHVKANESIITIFNFFQSSQLSRRINSSSSRCLDSASVALYVFSLVPFSGWFAKNADSSSSALAA